MEVTYNLIIVVNNTIYIIKQNQSNHNVNIVSHTSCNNKVHGYSSRECLSRDYHKI
jgi:hypothetical protein